MKMGNEFGLPPAETGAPLFPSGTQLMVTGADEDRWPASRPHPLNFSYTATRVDPELLKRLIAMPGVVKSERSELTHVFKMLRSLALQRMRQDGHQVLAVTSPRRIHGKSITSINVATIMAADLDSTALLVDADLQERRIQTLFGLEAEAGLAEHLVKQTSLASLLVNPAVARLVLLPAASSPFENSAELLASRGLRHVVQEMRGRYPDRIIVVDLPPLLDSADALAFLPLADTTLLVVEEHGTAVADLERAAELLAPFNLLGTVMTSPAEPHLWPEQRRTGWRRWWPFARRRSGP